MEDSDAEQQREKETENKVRAFYKNLLKACDKYDEIKESFDEIYTPINEQYQELAKIPGLVPRSSQTIIQDAFDSIDEVTGIADDFCSTLRGEFEPILERFRISIEDIVKEIAVEKAQQASSTSSSPSSSSSADINSGTSTNIVSSSNPIITKKIISMILVGIAAGSGGIAAYAILDLDVDTPFLSAPSNLDVIHENIVNFSWNALNDKSGIKHYHFELYDETNNQMISSKQVTSTSYSVELENGEYSWRIKAIDNAGNSGDFSQRSFFSVKIFEPPTAHIQTNTNSIKVGQTLQLNGGQSSDSDGRITSYIWDFGDRTTSNEVNPYHTYRMHGTYQVTLEVMDDDRLTDIFSIDIVVNTTPSPIIRDIYTPTGSTHRIVYPDTSVIVDFEWEQVFDDDGIAHYEIELDNQVYSQKFYDNNNSISINTEGKHEWRVRAIDNIGSIGPWSPTHTFAVDTIYPWTVAKISWNPTEYRFAENLGFIQVADNDVNNPNTTDSVSVRVTSPDNPRGISVTLRETGANTGIFIGTSDLTQVFEETNCNFKVITASYVDNRLSTGPGNSITLTADANKYHACIK